MTTAGLKLEAHARTLRHAWHEALRAVQSAGNTALSMRIGLQYDLASTHIGDWVSEFRGVLPETSFYLELDYSNQMCADLVAGALDLAVMFSPRPGPDLHFESVGEVSYRMVSTKAAARAQLDPESYILASYSPAFDQAHRRLLPDYSDAPVASGQSTAITGLLTTLGGSAFVLEETARSLIEAGQCMLIRDVAPIPQTVYAAIHVRHRHAHVHRRLLSIIRRHFGGAGPRRRGS